MRDFRVACSTRLKRAYAQRIGALTVVVTLAACFNDAAPELGDDDDNGTSSGSSTATATTATATATTGGTTNASSSTDPATTDPTSASSTTNSAESSTSADSSDVGMCSSGELCLPPAPPEWQGPVGVRVGQDPPACPRSFVPQELLMSLDAVPMSSCSCGCGSVDVQCSASVGIFADEDVDCVTPLIETVVTQTCSEPIGVAASARVQVELPIQQTVDCGIPIRVDDIPTLETTSFRVCVPPRPKDSCGDDGGCFTNEIMSFDRQCVIRPGDVMCPPNQPYSERTTVSTEIPDNRGCPGCDCDSPTAVTCGSIAVRGSTDCSGPPAQAGSGTCESLPNAAGDITLRFQPPTVRGGCTPSDGAPEPTGSATLGQPLTLCCRP